MARVTVEDCLEQVENRFALVHMAAKRSRQLLNGDKPLVHAPKNKEATVALREIAARSVEVLEEKPTRGRRAPRGTARRPRRPRGGQS